MESRCSSSSLQLSVFREMTHRFYNLLHLRCLKSKFYHINRRRAALSWHFKPGATVWEGATRHRNTHLLPPDTHGTWSTVIRNSGTLAIPHANVLSSAKLRAASLLCLVLSHLNPLQCTYLQSNADSNRVSFFEIFFFMIFLRI